MGDNNVAKILCTIVMVLDIIAGAFVVLVGVNFIFHFFTDGLDLDLMDAIQWVFYGLCLVLLGVIIICFEVKFKRDMVTREFGFLKHYLGKGTYVFFISILGYSYDGWMWGGKNVSYGTGIGLISAILCWVLYGCFDHKQTEHS